MTSIECFINVSARRNSEAIIYDTQIEEKSMYNVSFLWCWLDEIKIKEHQALFQVQFMGGQ